MLKVVQAINQRSLKNKIIKKQVFVHWQDVIDYLKTKSSFKGVEELLILFLDNKAKLMREETMQTGTVDKVRGYPREIIRRAIELGSSSFIIVHNHTSGDPLPSKADINFTNELALASETLDVCLQDHIILGKNSYFSFQEKGLLP